MKKVICCVGTRPNFIKIVKFQALFEQAGIEYRLLHTGQHFDRNMSEVFFEELGLGEPDYYLGIGGGTHGQVVGRITEKVEQIFMEEQPDLVIVPGDVNSTFACAFAASSLRIPVAHIESGLRSFDMDMPEERNRILTDAISDLLLVTEQVGMDNLAKEGKSGAGVQLVGNTMVDALRLMMPVIEKSNVSKVLGVEKDGFMLCTFHRPVNVDQEDSLRVIADSLKAAAGMCPVVFPIHPRTRKRLQEFGLQDFLDHPGIKFTDPIGYIDFIHLVSKSKAVLSDSGGIQTETSFLDIPCFTVRDTTELWMTVEQGTNTLLPLDAQRITAELEQLMQGQRKNSRNSELWDGMASERCMPHFLNLINA